MILRLFCCMLLACMKCDFQSNGIFNILKINTYIHVIPHFQCISFYFRVNKMKSLKKIKLVGEKRHDKKKHFHRRHAERAGKYI